MDELAVFLTGLLSIVTSTPSPGVVGIDHQGDLCANSGLHRLLVGNALTNAETRLQLQMLLKPCST